MISLGIDWHYCHEVKAWSSGMLAVPHTHVSSISPLTPWLAQVEDMPGQYSSSCCWPSSASCSSNMSHFCLCIAPTKWFSSQAWRSAWLLPSATWKIHWLPWITGRRAPSEDNLNIIVDWSGNGFEELISISIFTLNYSKSQFWKSVPISLLHYHGGNGV